MAALTGSHPNSSISFLWYSKYFSPSTRLKTTFLSTLFTSPRLKASSTDVSIISASVFSFTNREISSIRLSAIALWGTIAATPITAIWWMSCSSTSAAETWNRFCSFATILLTIILFSLRLCTHVEWSLKVITAIFIHFCSAFVGRRWLRLFVA